MSRWRLILRSLLHHWRLNVAVGLGVTAGTAVLTGALLVGDSGRLILVDEPTGNLDRTTAAGIGELLLELQQEEQAMLIVVTHSPDLASRLSRQAELDDGRLK